MTEGKPVRLIIAFALPLMLGNIFQQLYTMVDTIIVGRALGVSALAAVGASDGLNWLILSGIQGFTQGFSIKMAQEFGAGQHRKLCKVIGNSVMISVILTVIFTVASQVICEPVLRLMQTPESIIDGAALYLRVVFLGIPVIMAYNYLSALLRALGDGKTPLTAMIVASFVNIVLDLIFVLVFRWGIAGAAAATVVAQVCSALYCLNAVRKIDILRFEKTDFVPDFSLNAVLMKLGTPMAFQNAIICMGCIVLQYVVNGFGVLFVAGMTATNKLYGLLEVAATSYGYAMVTYVGQNLGAGKINRISRGMRSAISIGCITACIIMACMLIFGKVILGMFISGTPEEVEMTMKIAYGYLAVMSVGLPILYVLHVTRSALQGMGDTVLPMVSGFAELVMRSGAVFLLPAVLGEFGVFLAEPFAWLGADFILIPSYLIRMKRIKKQLQG